MAWEEAHHNTTSTAGTPTCLTQGMEHISRMDLLSSPLQVSLVDPTSSPLLV